MLKPVLLTCSDPFEGRRADPHFVPEAKAARDLGALVGLIDHDALLAGYPGDAVRNVPKDAGAAWYRGWMIPSAHYAALEAALAARGTPLFTSAEQYRTAHELPGWYDVFEAVTPRSAWFAHQPLCPAPRAAVLALADEIIAASKDAGTTTSTSKPAGIVKDYVKSAKHLWSTACHVPNLTDSDALERTVAAFITEQAEFLSGGIVLREFEDFGGPDGSRAPEARVWWLDGEPILITAHPDTPRTRIEPNLADTAPHVGALPARFICTDVVQRRDGVWRVVEVGDGQVSDLPPTADPAALIAVLMTR